MSNPDQGGQQGYEDQKRLADCCREGCPYCAADISHSVER